jgi:hypothetical protein
LLKPIPKKLLIHSGSYKQKDTKDKWGAETGTPTTTNLSYIRIEPSSAIKKSKDNKEIQLKSLLFYDCVNSLPAGVSFELENTITFSGIEYVIKSIDTISALSGIHHYEIGLA